MLALNLMSSPGSGKTTLLERTVRALGADLPVSVLEGDQETVLDADRIGAAGARAVQINTGAGCHLDADLVARALVGSTPRTGRWCSSRTSATSCAPRCSTSARRRAW